MSLGLTLNIQTMVGEEWKTLLSGHPCLRVRHLFSKICYWDVVRRCFFFLICRCTSLLGFQKFLLRISHSNHCFLIGNTFIFLAPFFYCFNLQLLHHVWVWISLSLSFQRFVVLLTSVSLCLLLNLGKFQTFFSLKQVFSLLSLLLLGF